MSRSTEWLAQGPSGKPPVQAALWLPRRSPSLSAKVVFAQSCARELPNAEEVI